MANQYSTSSILSRIMSKIIKQANGCWEWQGYKDRDGYGVYSKRSVHRWMYAEHKGTIPKNMCVCHHCDNPSCCNPTHLFIGTHADNVKDSIAKKRKPIGEQSMRAKLTNKQVHYIKYTLLPAGLTQTSIAKSYNISITTIHYIKHNKQWKHI